MPIYEFNCHKCGKEFEELIVHGRPSPICPYCGSSETEKLMSCCARQNKKESFSFTGSAGSGGCSGCSGGNCASCHH